MTTVKRLCAVLFFLGAAVGGLPAVTAGEVLTLPEAVEKALASGPDLLIARLEAERAGDSRSETRSAYWPHLGVSSAAGYTNRLDEQLRTVDSKGVERRYGLASIGNERGWLNIFLRQLVLDLQTWRSIQKSELEARVAQAAQREQREAIAFATLERYVTVLQMEALVALDLERLRQAERLDELAGVLLEGGRALAADREQVSIHLAEVRMESDLQKQALADARAGLWRIIGVDEAEAGAVQLARETIPAPQISSPRLEDTEVLAATAELETLSLRQRAEELEVSMARAGRYPTLALEMGYRHFGTKRYDNFEDDFLVAVDFQIPLFDGFRSWYAIEGASKEVEIARLRYQTLLTQKRDRVRELRRHLEATQQQPELARRRAAAARERARLADVRLQARRGTIDEALVAQTAYGPAAAVAVDAEFDRVLLWATLRREAGLLVAAILAAPALTPDP